MPSPGAWGWAGATSARSTVICSPLNSRAHEMLPLVSEPLRDRVEQPVERDPERAAGPEADRGADADGGHRVDRHRGPDGERQPDGGRDRLGHDEVDRPGAGEVAVAAVELEPADRAALVHRQTPRPLEERPLPALRAPLRDGAAQRPERVGPGGRGAFTPGCLHTFECRVRGRIGREGAVSVETKLMTAEQLWLMPDDGMRHELVRGELRTMSPTGVEHGGNEGGIYFRFVVHAREQRIGRVVVGEVGFRLSRDPDTVRAADVAFI